MLIQDALKNLIDTIFAETPARYVDIVFHRELAATDCPGKLFTDRYLIYEFLKRTVNIISKFTLIWQLVLRKLR